MSDLLNSVRLTWQLVSQFVSWEFCRYMSEQKQDVLPETDVLTYLRDMIVQRTLKSPSEITKHEIVAKFIMEAKEMKNISRMSSFIPLSESVKKIVPELEPAVSKLKDYLETFLYKLEFTDEIRFELIQIRIKDAIDEFVVEANKFLPQPHLLQVVESFSTQHEHLYPKPLKKVIYNAALLEKALECLHFESITENEEGEIKGFLCADEVFNKILLNAKDEPEQTVADSEQFSLSVNSSQHNEHIYSQEFVKNTQICCEKEIPVHLQPPATEYQEPDSLDLDRCLPAIPDDPNVADQVLLNEYVHIPDTSEPHSSNQPSHPVPSLSPPVLSPVQQPLSSKKLSENSKNHESYNHMQFAQSSANESPSEDSNSTLERTVTRKFRQIYNNQRAHKVSDSDTSDCDKNAEIRFLTPSLFRKKKSKKPLKPKSPPQPKVVYLSDMESFDSSIATNGVNSQKNDPNWTMRNTTQSQKKKSQKTTKTNEKKKPQKKPVLLIDSYSSDDENVFNYLGARTSKKPSSRKPSSAAHSNSEDERPTKSRRIDKNVKLYRSPNMSIQDFVTQIKRPKPSLLNEVPVHASTNTRPLRKRPTAQPQKKSAKMQTCKQCLKVFKTAIALRRHIFLRHRDVIADCDSN